MPAHHSVGSVTSVIAAIFTIRSISSLLLGVVALQLVLAQKEHKELLQLSALFCNCLSVFLGQ